MSSTILPSDFAHAHRTVSSAGFAAPSATELFNSAPARHC